MKKHFSNDLLTLLAHGPFEGKPVIRPIRTIQELKDVFRLTHECYVDSGFAPAHPSEYLVHFEGHFDHIPETSILVAVLQGKVVGSISYTVDGPVGFTTDKDFKAETEAILAEGKRVGVVWRLVIDKTVRSNLSILKQLIAGVIDLAVQKDIPTVLFAVNPRHVNVYRRMLVMDVVSKKSESGGLKEAPAVLLRGDRDTIIRKEAVTTAPDSNLAQIFELIGQETSY